MRDVRLRVVLFQRDIKHMYSKDPNEYLFESSVVSEGYQTHAEHALRKKRGLRVVLFQRDIKQIGSISDDHAGLRVVLFQRDIKRSVGSREPDTGLRVVLFQRDIKQRSPTQWKIG